MKRKHVTLSTIVEKPFAEKVNHYATKNGLSSSSLIKSLLEEEIDGKQTITSIYNDVNLKFYAMYGMFTQVLERLARIEMLLISGTLGRMLEKYQGRIPAEEIETYNILKKEWQSSIEDAKSLGAELKKILSELKGAKDHE